MIDKILEIASNDKDNLEKLAYVDKVLDQQFEFKDEFVREQQEFLERTDEKLEKLAEVSPEAIQAAEAVGRGLGRTAVGAGRGALIGKLIGGSAGKGALVGSGLSLAGDAVGALAKKHISSQQKMAGTIQEKQANIGAGFKQGLGLAGAGMATMLGTALVNDMYSAAKNALTKGRNFERMVKSEPELQNYPADKVKAYFNTLHEKGGPEMSGDPVIAAAFVKQQLDFHGSNILDQVSKMVKTRNDLAGAKDMGKLDMSGLTKMQFGSGEQKAPASNPYTAGY